LENVSKQMRWRLAPVIRGAQRRGNPVLSPGKRAGNRMNFILGPMLSARSPASAGWVAV
jgi:hypothetical protein